VLKTLPGKKENVNIIYPQGRIENPKTKASRKRMEVELKGSRNEEE